MTTPTAGRRPTRDGKENRILRRGAVGALGFMAVCFAALATVAAFNDQFVFALLMVGVAAVWSFPCAQHLLYRDLGPRIMVDTGGTTFRPSRGFDAMSAATAASAMVVFVAFGVIAIVDIDALWFFEKIRLGTIIYAFVLAAGCLIMLALLAQNGGIAYTRLTPKGFTIVSGFSTWHGAWSEVRAVTDVMPVRSIGWGPFTVKSADAAAFCPIAIEMSDGRVPAIDDADFITREGDALRDLIRFYWERPEYRMELTDGRATERLMGLNSTFEQRA